MYHINYTSGARSDEAETLEQVDRIIRAQWPEAVYLDHGDATDIPIEPTDDNRGLVWATEADSIDDPGARAVAEVVVV
jgi:hypothetical protein